MINVRVRDGMCPDPTTGDGGATEGDIRGSFSDIIDVVGVKDLAGGHCAVTQNSPAALSVLVAPGVVYIPNADYDELDSNQVRFWEAIVTVSTAVTITANTSGSTRIDLICAKMDTAVTPDEHASNIATLVAVAGTPGDGIPATPDNHYVLATVAVANGASTIVNADITSTRVQSKIDFDFLPKATGAEINTGTEDAKIVTPKAIADSYLSNGYNSLFRNALLNSNFDVWQRGISFGTPPGSYSADRWKAYNDATNQATTITRQDGTGVYGSTYCLRYQKTAGGTGTNIQYMTQSLESINSQKFRGKKVTLSFYARCGANYSPTSSILTAQILTGTGTDEDVLAGYTGGATVANENKTLTTSWQKFTVTTTNVLADTVNEIAVRFLNTPSGTAGAADYYEITQVQLCAGDVALPFMPKSINDEERDCRRFYRLGILLGVAQTTSWLSTSVDFATNPARVTPTTSNFKIYTTRANAVAEIAQQSLTRPGVGDTNISPTVVQADIGMGISSVQMTGTPLTEGKAYSGWYVLNMEL